MLRYAIALFKISISNTSNQDFPSYVVSFVKRFATGSYESVSSSAAAAGDDGLITRDTFGFRQIIVASTVFGNVFGIDSSNGNILWSRVLGLGWAAQVGGRVQVVKIYSIRTVNDGDTPQVVLVTQRRAENVSRIFVVSSTSLRFVFRLWSILCCSTSMRSLEKTRGMVWCRRAPFCRDWM